MTMKAILVPIEESDVLESMLVTALGVGERFGSYIEGQYDRPSLVESWGPEGLGSAAVMESLEQQDHEATRRPGRGPAPAGSRTPRPATS
jgi:hypothetical protein